MRLIPLPSPRIIDSPRLIWTGHILRRPKAKGRMIAGSAPLRVLVAEDEFLLAMEFADELQAMGAEVVAVKPTLASARAVTLAHRIDVAVLDINLRGELVYPLADELLARGIPVVFATGYDASAIPPRYASIECCEKPLMGSDLTAAVRRAVASLSRPAPLAEQAGAPEAATPVASAKLTRGATPLVASGAAPTSQRNTEDAEAE